MAQFEEEERMTLIRGVESFGGSFAEIIRRTFSWRATWFFHVLDSVNAMCLIFESGAPREPDTTSHDALTAAIHNQIAPAVSRL